MFDVAEIDFAWDSPWDSLEMKSVYQDIVFWILCDITREIDPYYKINFYKIDDPDDIFARPTTVNDLHNLFAACPSEISKGWFLFNRTSSNFSDTKVFEILNTFLFLKDKSTIAKPTIDEIIELLFARASHWSDRLTIEDLLPQLTSGRMIQVHDQSQSGGLPLNVIAEQVLFYKRPIRSDEQRILASALTDLGWRRHRTAQMRRWIAPPDFPTKDPGKLRWHYR
ncbi:MAG: hypothetical protein ABF617_10760 [Gluconobacter japonicus]|uniref:hypothetical protein n=1 Tax=Gluconobacter japonicus TaxID=376620 RepID=UPI0039E8CC50